MLSQVHKVTIAQLQLTLGKSLYEKGTTGRTLCFHCLEDDSMNSGSSQQRHDMAMSLMCPKGQFEGQFEEQFEGQFEAGEARDRLSDLGQVLAMV